eukprot:4007954-Pleurochrysis_carterae.AAC.1
MHAGKNRSHRQDASPECSLLSARPRAAAIRRQSSNARSPTGEQCRSQPRTKLYPNSRSDASLVASESGFGLENALATARSASGLTKDACSHLHACDTLTCGCPKCQPQTISRTESDWELASDFVRPCSTHASSIETSALENDLATSGGGHGLYTPSTACRYLSPADPGTSAQARRESFSSTSVRIPGQSVAAGVRARAAVRQARSACRSQALDVWHAPPTYRAVGQRSMRDYSSVWCDTLLTNSTSSTMHRACGSTRDRTCEKEMAHIMEETKRALAISKVSASAPANFFCTVSRSHLSL